MRANKPPVEGSKRDQQRGATFAEGGDRRMFKEQAANPAKSSTTGKPNVSGPGARSAKGGGRTPANIGGAARPARGGQTGPG